MHIFEDAREYLEKMKAHEHCCGTKQVRGLLAEAERLRAALSDARPFVANSDDDEDPDASRSASEVVAEIDRLIPPR